MIMTINEERISNMTSEDGDDDVVERTSEDNLVYSSLTIGQLLSRAFICIMSGVLLCVLVVSSLSDITEQKADEIADYITEQKADEIVDSMRRDSANNNNSIMEEYGITSMKGDADSTLSTWCDSCSSYAYPIEYVQDGVKHHGALDINGIGETIIRDENGVRLKPITVDGDNDGNDS